MSSAVIFLTRRSLLKHRDYGDVVDGAPKGVSAPRELLSISPAGGKPSIAQV